VSKASKEKGSWEEKYAAGFDSTFPCEEKKRWGLLFPSFFLFGLATPGRRGTVQARHFARGADAVVVWSPSGHQSRIFLPWQQY
jgi:hypothetical protein